MEHKNFELKETEKQQLLKVARNTLTAYIKNGNTPKMDESELSPALKTACGAFVTLHKNNQLRGCIGRFGAQEPLYKVVQDMTISSATQDNRFNPVENDELDDIDIEISVLTPMKKIDDVKQIELGKHGIYIQKGFASGTFLPQVANDTGWNLEEFLGHCARDKAHIGWDGWRDADVFTYEAIIFEEKKD